MDLFCLGNQPGKVRKKDLPFFDADFVESVEAAGEHAEFVSFFEVDEADHAGVLFEVN